MVTVKKACEKCEKVDLPEWGVVCPDCKIPLRRYTKENGEAYWDEPTKIIRVGDRVKVCGAPETHQEMMQVKPPKKSSSNLSFNFHIKP